MNFQEALKVIADHCIKHGFGDTEYNYCLIPSGYGPYSQNKLYSKASDIIYDAIGATHYRSVLDLPNKRIILDFGKSEAFGASEAISIGKIYDVIY